MAADGCQSPTASRRIVGGLVCLLGLLLFLRELHLPSVEHALRWFVPAAFLIYGSILLARPTRVGHRFWGGMALAVGAFLAAQRLGVLMPGDAWDFFWAALLVAGGGAIVVRSFRRPRERPGGAWAGSAPPPAGPAENSSTVTHTSLFSGQEIRNTSPAFAGGALTAVFGGCRLDLSGARTAPGGAILEVAAVFGGIVIRVPAGWDVRYEVTPVLGGIHDRTHRTAGGTAAGSLTIRGAVIMGAVEVSN